MGIHRQSVYGLIGICAVAVVMADMNRGLYWALMNAANSHSPRLMLATIAVVLGSAGLAALALSHLQNQVLKAMWLMLLALAVMLTYGHMALAGGSPHLADLRAFWTGKGFDRASDFYLAAFRLSSILPALALLIGGMMASPRRLLPPSFHRYLPSVRDRWLHLLIILHVAIAGGVAMVASTTAFSFVPAPVRVLAGLPAHIIRMLAQDMGAADWLR